MPKAPTKKKPATPVAPQSPIIQQYQEAKKAHPGMLLLFRIGDFYETVCEDAPVVAKTLGLTITTRGGADMAGFPYHQLEVYLQKLLKDGHRVAVCEQVQESTNIKPITVITTPPTATSPPALEVLYDSLDIVEYSSASKQGALTVSDAKQLLGWETEAEARDRFVKETGEPAAQAEPFGEVFHCKNVAGEKVRTTHNAHNRAFDEDWCEALVHTILAGQWAGPLTVPGETVNGETVRVSKFGRVLSGQHQLTALVLADEYLAKTRGQIGEEADVKWPAWKGHEHPVIETVVITGLSEDPRVLMTIDYCKPRSVADVFYTSDVFSQSTSSERKELCRMLAAAADFLWTRTDAQGYRTHPEVVGFLDRHKRLLKCVEHLFKENGEGRKVSKLRLSPGQAAAIMYVMGSAGPKTDGDVYRNESPPTEKGLDWSCLDRAGNFWSCLAGDKRFSPVRMALGRLVESDTNNTDNQGMGGRQQEKLAIIAKAWEVYKDDTSGTPFTDDDMAPGGALCLSYSDLDDKGGKLPDGQIKLLDVADFEGIDCPEVVVKKARSASPPMPPPPTKEEIEKATEDARQRRAAAQAKINAVRAKAKK